MRPSWIEGCVVLENFCLHHEDRVQKIHSKPNWSLFLSTQWGASMRPFRFFRLFQQQQNNKSLSSEVSRTDPKLLHKNDQHSKVESVTRKYTYFKITWISPQIFDDLSWPIKIISIARTVLWKLERVQRKSPPFFSENMK